MALSPFRCKIRHQKGLDSRAAAIIMRTVRNTVDTGRTVVCTIHQPSIDIFEAFDEFLLMKRGGQVIYAGPLGVCSHKLGEYIEAIPGVPKIRDGYNPATWMLEVTSTSVEAQLDIDFAEIYPSSTLYNQPVVGKERTVMYREKAAGMYSALAYAINQVIIEIFYIAVQTLVYGSMLFFLIDFPWDVRKYLSFIYFMFMCFVYYTLYRMMGVALTPNHHIVAIVRSFFPSF
ncbi:hypothetical protein EJ110_NYTH04967 [Nymphaea thermarum]|nr:hypothetical protein EJ110_NYTH04967 [Nymphaea thermarum]